MQNTSDTEMNSLIYVTPIYVIVYTRYKLLKTVRFWAHLTC